MKVLYVGGNGQISFDCVRESVRCGHDVAVFNRGRHNAGLPDAVTVLQGDFDDARSYARIAEGGFDVICQFRAFTAEHVQRDVELLAGRVGQYVFISSASAYRKPPLDQCLIEDVPLENPYSEYSRNKAAAEAVLQAQHALTYTIVRPSHTVRYDLPTAMGEKDTAAHRMLRGEPVVVPGDGTALWTLTHARDFAPPFVKLLGNRRALGDAFHLTGPHAYRWDMIYEAIGRALGVDRIEIVHVPTDTLLRYNPAWTMNLLGDKSWTSMFDNRRVQEIVGEFDCPTRLDELTALVVAEWRQRGGVERAPDADLDRLMDRIVAEQSALGT